MNPCQSRGTIVGYCQLKGTSVDQLRGTIVDHVGQSRGITTTMDVTILRLPNMQVNHQLMEEKRISVS